MSDRLAKQVAERLRDWRPAFMKLGTEMAVIQHDALPALARLVEAAHRCGFESRTDLASRLHHRKISSEEFVREMRDSQQAMDEALRRVAESLGINEAPTKETK